MAPPVLTVLASAAILTAAVWVHNHQTRLTAPTSLGSGQSNIVSDAYGQNGGISASDPRPPHVVSNESGNSQGTSGQRPTSSDGDSHSKPSEPPTAPQPEDAGFSPVSGGTVKALPDSPLSGGSQLSCIVTQYGQSPVSSFDGQPIVAPDGTVLALPQGVSSRDLVVLRLQTGVLWATVPKTSMDATTGRPGISSAPTPIFFTPYHIGGKSGQALTTGAISLGELPVSTDPAAAAQPAWYHNNGSGDTSVNTSASGACRLFLQGFYQTSNGAVIALTVNNATTGTVDNWMYLWNEQTKNLKPVAQIQNGHNTFGWFAVGRDVVYWETRHTIPPRDIHYQGQQYVMNVKTQTVTRIQLGTWSSQAVAFGNALVFQVGGSYQWQEFDPAPSIAPADSSPN